MNIPTDFNFVQEVFKNHNTNTLAFKDPDVAVTYDQLTNQVPSMARALTRLGLHKEQRVALVLNDSVHTAMLMLAVMYAGMVAVPLNPRSSVDNLRHCLTHSGSSLIIVEDDLVNNFPDLPVVAKHMTQAWCSGPALQPVSMHKDSAAFFLYTSGTTGHPKAVVHSHANAYTVGFRGGIETFGYTSTDLSYSTAKLFFAFGLFNFFSTLVSGCATFFNPAISRPSAMSMILEHQKPSIVLSVPALWGMLLKENFDNANLRMCLSSGDQLPQSLYDAWKNKTGIGLQNLLGNSETCCVITNNSAGVPNSIGVPVAGHEIKIMDDQLWIKSPSAGLCYWHDKEWSAKQFGEWMPTGDRVTQDSQGYLYHQGRIGDSIKVNGSFVNTVNIENAILKYPGIVEAAVVGSQDAIGHTRLKAFVVAEHASIDMQDLGKYLRQNTTETVRDIQLVAQLPRTENGKIQRYKLREQM